MDRILGQSKPTIFPLLNMAKSQNLQKSILHFYKDKTITMNFTLPPWQNEDMEDEKENVLYDRGIVLLPGYLW